MDYLVLLLAVICIAAQFNINRAYQKKYIRGFKELIFFPFACGMVNMVYFGVLSQVLYGGLPQITRFSVVMSATLGIVSVSVSIVGMQVMKFGNLSVYSVFMMLGGMILPFVYGVLFLDEYITITRIAGLGLLVFALPCSVAKSADKNNLHKAIIPVFYLLCLLVFMANGTNSIISKAHAINDAAVAPIHFVFLINLWQTILSGVLFFTARHRIRLANPGESTRTLEKTSIGILVPIVSFALVSGTGFLFMVTAAQSVPAVVQFPFVTGGSIVLSTIGAWILFKEKLSNLSLAGVGLAMVGTLFFLL